VPLPLLTDRLALRAFVPGDGAELHATVYGEREVMRHVGGALDRAAADAALERWIVAHDRDGLAFFAVVERETGLLAGEAGLVPFGGEGPGVELGYTLGRAYWGRGYATEAGTALLAEAFGPLGLDEVLAVTRPQNAGSQRVLRKLGFTADGHADAWGARQLRFRRSSGS
jgi:ribosomal-protein-alanine N-acetyltransferase